MAEGHSAYDAAPASGADAFYNQEALVSALFDETAVNELLQLLSDSEVGHPPPTQFVPLRHLTNRPRRRQRLQRHRG